MKTIGCLFGGAIGDALGMPFTGLTRAEMLALGTVTDFRPAIDAAPVTIPLTALAEPEIDEPLGAGQWTDDTQLTLELAETLISEGGMLVPDAWAHGLVRWLNNAPRAPGLSSLEAAIQLRTGGASWDEAADPDGADCGAATRATPIGLAYSRDPALRRRCAVLQAATTHGHPDAQAAAVAVAEAVAIALPIRADGLACWDGHGFLTTIADAVRAQSPAFAEFARCLDVARALFTDGIDTETAVRVLGVSAWSREAVPSALFLVARDPHDPEALLRDAVNLTGGAVESIASIAGAVGGALHGVAALPARWRCGVEDPARLLEAALGLYRLSELSLKTG